jgi:hypothetical protein
LKEVAICAFFFPFLFLFSLVFRLFFFCKPIFLLLLGSYTSCFFYIGELITSISDTNAVSVCDLASSSRSVYLSNSHPISSVCVSTSSLVLAF